MLGRRAVRKRAKQEVRRELGREPLREERTGGKYMREGREGKRESERSEGMEEHRGLSKRDRKLKR